MKYEELKQLELASIRKFLEDNKEYLTGRVLDYGCGLSPYKDLCGEYVGYEKGQDLPKGPFDTVLCTQVIEFVDNPLSLLIRFSLLAPTIVMTYPTHWPETEPADLWRFTKTGMEALCREAGLTVLKHEPRASIDYKDFKLTLGYGIVTQN